MLVFKTDKKPPTPLSFAEDKQALKILNDLIELDELFVAGDLALVQRLLDNYKHDKDVKHGTVFIGAVARRLRKKAS